MGSVSTAEPAILAAAKDYLTGGNEYAYAVVDSQFGQPEWGNKPIPERVRQKLRPISTLQMGNGHPDALVAPPQENSYQDPGGDRSGIIPLAVIEAKGESKRSGRNAGRIAITQAHAHLEEANIGYAAVPQSLVSHRERALASELNIGLIAVDGGEVRLLEEPRIVGSDSSGTAETVRFHARLGGIAVENLTKNHPKNPLGYALAFQCNGETESIVKEYVIEAAADARRDAEALGLIRRQQGERELTNLGRESVRTMVSHYDSKKEVLEQIDNLYGRANRLIDELPVIGVVARQVLLAYPPTQVLVDTLDHLSEAGTREPALATVAKAIAKKRTDFALNLFVSTNSRESVIDESGDIDLSAFDDGNVYSTHTTFQYKAMLYHAGILSQRGKDKKSELDPTVSTWSLENTIDY
jgi:hypothetical protein